MIYYQPIEPAKWTLWLSSGVVKNLELRQYNSNDVEEYVIHYSTNYPPDALRFDCNIENDTEHEVI